MLITKEDLQDWNSHPVTKAIFKQVHDLTVEVSQRSCLRDTCDQTAMQVARNEGFIEGIGAIKETYEDLEEASS